MTRAFFCTASIVLATAACESSGHIEAQLVVTAADAGMAGTVNSRNAGAGGQAASMGGTFGGVAGTASSGGAVGGNGGRAASGAGSGGLPTGGSTGGMPAAGGAGSSGRNGSGASGGAASASGAGLGGAPATCTPVGTAASAPQTQSGDVVVTWNEKHQVMVGFGASDKEHSLLTDQQADLFFSATAGIGLSLLRVAIDPNGEYIGTPANSKLAADRGAKVWALPWSPPGEWKDNGSTANGGHLLAAHYAEWATRLAGFQDTLLQSTGVTLFALSAQNESNYTATWDSCLYTPDEMTAFVKVLGPLLAQKSPRPLFLSPEAASWAPLWDYTTSILADTAAAAYVDVFSVHQYSGVTAPQTTARSLWETEYSTFDAPLATIGNGIAVAQQVYQALVLGNASAWHYWWLIGRNDDNEGLLNQGAVLTKRLYTVGNFSKFVRPGFVRVGTSTDPSGVNTAAFKDECSGAFAVVVINGNGSDVPYGFGIDGATVTTATPWVTSESLDLAVQSDISASAGRFSTTLPAMSVTTFVGTAE